MAAKIVKENLGTLLKPKTNVPLLKKLDTLMTYLCAMIYN